MSVCAFGMQIGIKEIDKTCLRCELLLLHDSLTSIVEGHEAQELINISPTNNAGLAK